MLYLDLFCASIYKMCLKVISSLLYAISAYERFHKNALLVDWRGNLHLSKLSIWRTAAELSTGRCSVAPGGPAPRKTLISIIHAQLHPAFAFVKGFTKKECRAFAFKCQSNVPLFKNKSVLLKVTDKTKGGKAGKEQGEEKPWHQCLENGSLWVENVPVVSPRQDLKQRSHAEKLMENQSKVFLGG